ncbi:MAG: 4-alpha-glucanotransferase [Candidatus Manganitrophaceae bacterium]
MALPPIKQPLFLNRKICGVMIPLFSVRSETGFGIGEILDLIPLIDWMAERHLHLLQILPFYEMSPHETSPYQALSGFALDPIYLSLLAWDDFKQSAAAQKVFASPEVQKELGRLRANTDVLYEAIRPLKEPLFEAAFQHFLEEEWKKESPRADAFRRFMAEQSGWLNDYALFRLLKEKNGWSHWNDWPEPFRDRDAAALKEFERQEEGRLLLFKYLQWAVWEQWKTVLEEARRKNVLIMGDLPFLVSRDSADLWSRRHAFSAVESVGAPPDMFNARGQDWGLPLFLWKVMEEERFLWWRLRIGQARSLFHLIRLDHVVGFYRVWVMPRQGAPFFEPPQEEEQIRRGTELLNAIVEESGGENGELIPVAEDLGVIPDFVRESLRQFGIAGHKIFRWEKEGLQYRDPRDYPFVSLATTGTHDTSTIVQWWESLPSEERSTFLAMLDERREIPPDEPFSDRLHRTILERLIAGGSGLVVFPIQDILGLPDQINIPATVGPHNWRFRLTIQVDQLNHLSPFREKLATLQSLIDRHHRYAGSEPLFNGLDRPVPDKSLDKPGSRSL